MTLKELIRPTLLAMAVFAALLTACTYEELKPVKIEIPDSVKFALNIVPIFNTSCNVSGCHNQGGIPPDLSAENAYNSLTFFGYVDVESPESSVIYEKISTGSMKDNASEQDVALMLEWIKQGAKNN